MRNVPNAYSVLSNASVTL